MVNYSCEKCGKEFGQKGHYTKHLNNLMVSQTLDLKEIHGRYLFLTRFKNRNKTTCSLFPKFYDT